MINSTELPERTVPNIGAPVRPAVSALDAATD